MDFIEKANKEVTKRKYKKRNVEEEKVVEEVKPVEVVKKVVKEKLPQAVLDADRYIGKRGYVIRKNRFTEAQIEKLQEDLYVKPSINETFGADSEPFEVYLENDNKIYLPKFYGIAEFGQVPPECNITSKGKDIDLDFKLELRPHQVIAAEKTMEAYYNRGGGILSLYCGAGKTILALYFISMLKKKTLIIVHKTFLMNQWKERIEFALPNAKVGILQGPRFDKDCDILIAMLQSLSFKQYPRESFDDIGHVIIDECHRVPSKCFSRALFKINTQYMVGLSATPTRKDGLTKVLKWFVGDIIYSLKAANETNTVRVERFLCESDVPEYNKEVTNYTGNVVIATMLNNICGYFKRTQILMRKVLEELNAHQDRQILILSDRKQHLADMEKYAKQMNFTSVGYYVGGMKEVDLKKSESCKLLLGTFPMANEGLDIKSLNGLVIASPKSDIIQSVGRILRQKHQIEPLIIDMVDRFSVFENQAKKRFEVYRKNKYHIFDTTINIDDDKILRKKEYKLHLDKDSESEEELFDIDDSEEDNGEMSFDNGNKKRVQQKKYFKKEVKKEVPKMTKEELKKKYMSDMSFWTFEDDK